MKKQRWEESEKRREEKSRAEQRREEEEKRKRRGREEKRREEKKKENQRRERVRRKKMQVREKVEKSQITGFFQWFVAPDGRKISKRRLAWLKRRAERSGERWKIARRCGAKHISKSKCTKHTNIGALLEVEMLKKCTPLWREAHFEVKMYKTHKHRSAFGSWDVEKVHAVVARSTFRSQHQHVKNTTCSDRFWKLRCWKIAHRCGTKHISKSKR